MAAVHTRTLSGNGQQRSLKQTLELLLSGWNFGDLQVPESEEVGEDLWVLKEDQL